MSINPKAFEVASTSRTDYIPSVHGIIYIGRCEPIICKSTLDWAKLNALAICKKGAARYANARLPIKVRGTAPGNMKWSYYRIVDFNQVRCPG